MNGPTIRRITFDVGRVVEKPEVKVQRLVVEESMVLDTTHHPYGYNYIFAEINKTS